MIKSIKHISRKQFNTINFYPVSNPPDPNSFSYISIYGNESYEKVPPRINHKLWFNGLQLKFDDVDEDRVDAVDDNKVDTVDVDTKMVLM